MNHRGLLSLSFLALVVLGVHRVTEAKKKLVPTAASVTRLSSSIAPAQSGNFPLVWNSGVNCSSEPDFQVHAYNEDFFIIRQSKCAIFEAPFLYLIFGDEGALLLDTGSNSTTDVWGTVNQIIERWLDARGMDHIRLVVAHSHSHGDHIQGDAQFVDKPYVSHIVGLTNQAVRTFFGFQDYPNDVPTFDLGNRVIDVLGTPGHHTASITLYDRRTQILLTGDLVYPGHLFIFGSGAWTAFRRSIRRLTHWANTHPVKWVLGCHIEFSDVPFVSYPYATAVQPNEHVLQFPASELVEIQEATESMWTNPQCQIFDEFVIHPVYLCGIMWNG
ncbi:MAG: hydroxyacylglutathione hydrolase [Planctomycetota bacterium]|jgi:hydroxyacylglutathione hydrolase